MSKQLYLIPIAAALTLSACASGKVGLDPQLKVVEYSALPEPTRLDMTAPTRPFLIGPFDKLKIDVFGVEDLEREVQTDASGRFSYPLIGMVDASGRTPEELKVDIEQRLARFVRDPQVSVNLAANVSQAITVEGEVKEPGIYPVMGNMTLVKAVATAGGTGELASLDDVVVFRKVDGQRYIALYNLQAIRRGNYADPEIYPNDVVIVGESTTRRLFRDIIAGVPAILTPVIAIAGR